MLPWINRLFGRKAPNEILEPPIRYEQTQRLLKQVAEHYQSDFIAYWGAYHSDISDNDVVVFHELLQYKKPTDQLFLFIKSNGGSGESALRLIHLLRQSYRRIVVLAPIDCASAATMLALGADEIHMGPLSFLTAIDTSITHDLSPVDVDDDLVSVSQNELDRVLKLWNQQKVEGDKNPYLTLYKHIHPLVFGAVDRASSLSIRLTSEILSYHMDDSELIESISNHLNAEYPSHGYPITARQASRIGLNIQPLDPAINELLVRLNHLYSEMAQRAYTDHDEYKYHDNQIYTIIETSDLMIYYQSNKDHVWRKEDKQWVSVNDQSSWIRVERGEKSVFHIR